MVTTRPSSSASLSRAQLRGHNKEWISGARIFPCWRRQGAAERWVISSGQDLCFASVACRESSEGWILNLNTILSLGVMGDRELHCAW